MGKREYGLLEQIFQLDRSRVPAIPPCTAFSGARDIDE